MFIKLKSLLIIIIALLTSCFGYSQTDSIVFNNNNYIVGDLDLLTKIILFPSITESGRWRSDFNFDVKYDLPLDFYIKAGITLNRDNRPVEGASETDYVIHTGFGWEW
ncbi:MAG: hypothetical protein K8R53_10540 [Bacteroidales bacterium]|nr:hypothetical protein [Bacteroidales bacterium]